MDNLFLKIRDGVNKAGVMPIRREHFFMILMGAIVGATTGCAAIGFRELIGAVAQLVGYVGRG